MRKLRYSYLVVGALVLAQLSCSYRYPVISDSNVSSLDPERVVADNRTQQITSFSDCVAAGYPIQKTKPARCLTPEGIMFIEDEGLGNGEGSRGTKLCKDLCGDGQCESVVCLGSGCPCAETKGSCPQDCE